MTLTKYEVDNDMRNFMSVVWPRIKALDEDDLREASFDNYNDIMDMDIELEECPFCGEFTVCAESVDNRFHIVCNTCDSSTRGVFADGSSKEIREPFDQLVPGLDDKLDSFANDSSRLTDAEWHLYHKYYRAMCSLIAIYLASECWNRRAN